MKKLAYKPLFIEESPKVDREKSVLEKINLTEKDFEMGALILEKEKIDQPTREKIFPAVIYWILSSSQDHEKQAEAFSKMKYWGLLEPEAILNDSRPKNLESILKRVRFSNQKKERIVNFAKFWTEPESRGDRKVIDELVEDISNGHEYGFQIRDEVANTFPGIGPKCASCLLIALGYHYVVPVDVHMLKFLDGLGYDVKLPDYKTIGGMRGGVYHLYEGILCNLARLYEVTPALFQASVWGKRSNYSGMYHQLNFGDF
jgi:endonuclease III